MSVPQEADFALVKRGNGASPEVFAVLCGIQDVSITRTANTSDRFVRDCAKPGQVPFRKVKTSGKQMDISAAGLIDVPSLETFEDALGVSENYKIELYADDGTDAGSLLGTISGPFVPTTANTNVPRESAGASEFNLASDGEWTWEAE